MTQTLEVEQIHAPTLPAFVVDRVGRPVMPELWQSWAWRSDEEIEPTWCHRGVPSAQRTVLDRYWMFAHSGIGLNSHAIGLVCRSGPLLLELQAGWGGETMDLDLSTASVNAIIDTWNRWWPEVEAALSAIDAQEIKVAVVFSHLRTSSVQVRPGAPEWLAHSARSLLDELQEHQD